MLGRFDQLPSPGPKATHPDAPGPHVRAHGRMPTWGERPCVARQRMRRQNEMPSGCELPDI